MRRLRAALRRTVTSKLTNGNLVMTTEEVLGYSSESNAIEAVSLGVCGHLVEPFRAADVLAVVTRALNIPAA